MALFEGPRLLSLPLEVLEEHILCLLSQHSLISCRHTCRELNQIITSSVLLEYLKELDVSGMIDNPLFSHNTIALNERATFLKDHKCNWRYLMWKWDKWSDPQPQKVVGIACADAGVIYFKCQYPAYSLKSLKLPTRESDNFVWESIDLGKQIIRSAIDISGRDLLSLVTLQPISPNNSIHMVQIDLLTHSSRQPHPSATQKTLDLFTLDLGQGNDPAYADIAVCGNHLAVIAGCSWPYQVDFMILDWTTGAVKFIQPGRHRQLGLMFLREDLLVVGDPSKECLMIYHIPPSAPTPLHHQSSEGSKSQNSDAINLIRMLHLPKANVKFKYGLKQIKIRSDSSAPYFASSSLPSGWTPTSSQPVILNPLASLITLFCIYDGKYGSSHQFLFVLHFQTLLQHALHALELMRSRPDPANEKMFDVLPWEAWGPDSVRMIDMGLSDIVIRSSYTRGTKLYMASLRALEVLDFGPYEFSPARFASPRNLSFFNGGDEPRVDNRILYPHSNPVESEWFLFRNAFGSLFDIYEPHPDDEPSPFGHEVLTRLPFVSSTHKHPLWTSSTHEPSIYVDENRIVYLHVCVVS